MLSFRGVVAFWILYGVVHAVFRLSVSRTLTIDDARANELTQNFALGYQLRQPPLYEWLLWSVQQALGPGIGSHLLVRYSLIALIGVTTFGAVRAAVKDDRWAAAASLSLIFCYPVSWTFHEWATQTLLLCSACMLTLHAGIRFLEQPGKRTAVFLGAALAFGFYSKFSFPLMAGGLLLAALSLPEARRKLADRYLLLSLAVVLLALSPYAYWVVQVQGNVAADLAGHLVDSKHSYAARVASGLLRLAGSIPVFLLPWLAAVALFAPRAFLPRATASAPASIAERLALRTMIFAVLLTAAGVVLTGATNVAARYMHPVLFIAPIFVFARVARFEQREDRIRQFAVVAVIAAIAILAIRFVAVTDNPLTREAGRRLLLPYPALAKELTARGYDRGTVVTPDVRDAGNLRALLPQLRVIGRSSLRVEQPPKDSEVRTCRLVWMDDGSQGRQAQRAVPDENLSGAERIEILPRPNWFAPSWGATWYVQQLDPSSPVCG